MIPTIYMYDIKLAVTDVAEFCGVIAWGGDLQFIATSSL